MKATGLEKLTEDKRNEVVDLLSRGYSIRATSREANVPIHYVKLAKRIYEIPDATKRKVERNSEIVRMRDEEGMTYEEIAKKLGGGISRQRVYYIYHRDHGARAV